MKIKNLLVLSVASLLVAGCSLNTGGDEPSPTPTPTPTPTPVDPTYKDKDVVAHVFGQEGLFECRFYDNMPHVPYVEVGSFLEDFYDKTTTVSKSGDEVIYSKNDHFIKVNAKTNTLSVSNLDYFSDWHYADHPSSPMRTLIALDSVYPTDFKPAVFNMAEYGINLYEKDNKAYVPLATMSDMLSYVESLFVCYNGQDIYFDNTSIWSSQSGYYDYIFSHQRQEDMVDFNYRELCFSIDKLNGKPENVGIGRDDLLERGLHAILLEKYPEVINLLYSADPYQYSLGQYILFINILYDYGHGEPYVAAGVNQTNYFNIINNNPYLLENENYQNVVMNHRNYAGSQCINEKNAAFNSSGSGYYFYTDDDMNLAYIGFNEFSFNTGGWDAYINGLSSEMPTDSYGWVRSKLNYCKTYGYDDVVIDLTWNGGGANYAQYALTSMFASRGYDFNFHDMAHEDNFAHHVELDYNLDGTFNEQDYIDCQNDLSGLKIAFMTTSWSFSNGNALPMHMKDLGYMIVGEQSGGGSCTVGNQALADGIPYRTSSRWKFNNKDHLEFDSGVPVDLDLVDGDSYARFYNTVYLRNQIDAFYA